MRHKVRRLEVLEKNEKKRGFTLIELLAVVAILAIVIGISYGVYIGVINKSKEKASTLAMNSLMQAAELYSKEDDANNIKWLSSYDQGGNVNKKYVCLRVQQLVNAGYFKEKFFNKDVYGNKINANTFIEVSKDTNSSNVKVNISDENNQTSCESNILNDNIYDMTITDGSIYTDALEFTVGKASNSSEGQISNVRYKYKNNDSTVCNNDKCELDGLESSTIHTIQVCMDAKNNGKSKTICNYIDKRTADFVKPDIKVSNANSWAKSKEITIKYYNTNIKDNNGYHYVKSQVAGNVIQGNIYKCSGYNDNNKSSECDTKKALKISENEWYMIKDDVAKITVSKDTISQDINKKMPIKARIQDKTSNYADNDESINKVDVTPPNCDVGGGSNGWTNSNVTLIGKCSDNGSGCKELQVKATFSSTGTYSPGTVYDNAGNQRECDKEQVNIDKTKPTCTVSYSGGTKGNDKWYKKGTSKENPVQIIANCSDSGGSGCENNIPSIPKYEDGQHSGSITVKDMAGNTGSCNYIVKIDTTAPSCESSGGSDSWKNQNVKIEGKCSDNGSRCSSDTNVSKNITWETSETFSPGTVYDNAGNSTVCPNQTVKIDKTAPTFSSLKNPTNGKWTNKSFALTGNASDSRSGIDYWYYKYSGEESKVKYDNSANKEIYTTTNFSRERNQQVTIYVCDKAGNCSSKSTNIKIDKTPPEIHRGSHAGFETKTITYNNSESWKFTFSFKDTGGSGISSSNVVAKVHTKNGNKTICNAEDESWKSGDICSGKDNSKATKWWRAYKAYDNAGNYSEMVCYYHTNSTKVTDAKGSYSSCKVNGYEFK